LEFDGVSYRLSLAHNSPAKIALEPSSE